MPDLAALRGKIAVMRSDEPDREARLRHPLDVVDEDLERLMETPQSA